MNKISSALLITLAILAGCNQENKVTPAKKVETTQSDIESLAKKSTPGDAQSQYELGFNYAQKNDFANAIKWFSKAAEQGNADAQYSLGLMYVNGDDVPKNYDEAFKLLRKAAVHGNVKAQFNLGLMYYNGNGTPKNAVLAYVWNNIAARQGYENAQINHFFYAKAMTWEQIDEAQKLIANWKPGQPIQ